MGRSRRTRTRTTTTTIRSATTMIMTVRDKISL